MNKKVITVIFCLCCFFSQIQAQNNYKHLVDSLKYVRNIPYIDDCDDPVLYHIVAQGLDIVPALIDKMDDTKKIKDLHVRFFGGEYTVGDVAFVALEEIIGDIPTFELLGTEFSPECGYCSFWWAIRESKKRRRQFKQNVQNWYNQNKDNLVWTEKLSSNIGDCYKGHGVTGHYVLKQNKKTN